MKGTQSIDNKQADRCNKNPPKNKKGALNINIPINIRGTKTLAYIVIKRSSNTQQQTIE
jgi:hypothetical protein